MIITTFTPQEIRLFLREHPVKWFHGYNQDTFIGGRGNKYTLTPAVDVFFTNLIKLGGLFTQREFIIMCINEWQEWFEKEVPDDHKKAFQARIGRNFYPSFIDSLHVWALLHEQLYWDGRKVFDKCTIDTHSDVRNKNDLILHRGDETIRVALSIDSRNGRASREYKKKYRNSDNDEDDKVDRVELLLPMSRPQTDGNKRWYEYPDDFVPIFKKVEQCILPGFEFPAA